MDLGGADRCLFSPGNPGESHRIALGTGIRERLSGAWGGKFRLSNGKARHWGGLGPVPRAVGGGRFAPKCVTCFACWQPTKTPARSRSRLSAGSTRRSVRAAARRSDPGMRRSRNRAGVFPPLETPQVTGAGSEPTLTKSQSLVSLRRFLLTGGNKGNEG